MLNTVDFNIIILTLICCSVTLLFSITNGMLRLQQSCREWPQMQSLQQACAFNMIVELQKEKKELWPSGPVVNICEKLR